MCGSYYKKETMSAFYSVSTLNIFSASVLSQSVIKRITNQVFL